MQQQGDIVIKVNRPLRILNQKDNIYSKVDNEKRIRLLHLVKEKGKSLKEASQILDINYSTAKTILRIYRIEKRILKKSSIVLNNQTESEGLLDNEMPPLSLQSSSVDTNYSASSSMKPKVISFNHQDTFNYCSQLHNLITLTKECVEQVIMNEMIIQNISCTLNQISANSVFNNCNCIGGNKMNYLF